ncbi:MAG: glycoside hydrolase family 57 protein [Candidatus Omnitrophica bacterium]|nr:glycoside hydrolase family 57 protein [Candidatus Omnitrophota bacterium]MDD5775172.1 glycoside hydrolase family 57 protein [Candidatus Omnitrophota bacterium]
MLYLALIYHNHQPYYKNLLTGETDVPWVRLHGTKDYLDMVLMLEKFPDVKATFNLVPSLVEQIEDYQNKQVIDKFLDLSYKPVAQLTHDERTYVVDNFFMINRDKVIAFHPRYYELSFKALGKKQFTDQDILDLQVWFNLAWIDPYFREKMPQLQAAVNKGRFFSEEDKRAVLDAHLQILADILPGYKAFMDSKQIEVILSPYYHPILPLLYNTNLAKEANPKSTVPAVGFAFPQDAKAQIASGVAQYIGRFNRQPLGMWPSEESVCEHIVPYFIESGIRWIVTDEAILFKSLRKKRNARLLYQPHMLKREEGNLQVIFRDRNLSDLIGFTYPQWNAADAVNDFMYHLENISKAFKNKDALVTIALDGENAWEYYRNDGHDFLELLYGRLSEAKFLKTVTPGEYLQEFPAKAQIKRLAAGSWIYGEFSKWINNPYKNKGWEYLAIARQELQKMIDNGEPVSDKAWKQMYIAEGSDWYWWFGEDYPGYFDRLYRMHMSNFYTLINKPIPDYLNHPIKP